MRTHAFETHPTLWLAKLIVCLIAVVKLLSGQTSIDLRTQSRSVDFSAASSTKPSKTGSSLPPVCQQGETYFLVTAAPGENLYGCTAPNTWSQLGAAPVSTVFGRSGDVVPQSGDYSFSQITGTLGVAQGGTGATSASQARTNLGAAASAHTHALSELTGVTGKQGTGSVLQAYSGAAPADGNCARFDSGGNLVDAGAPCGTGGGSYSAGEGVVITGGAIEVDDAVIPSYLVGNGAPALSCQAGRDWYTDLTGGRVYFCKAANVWQEVVRTGNVDGSDVATGTIASARLPNPTTGAGGKVQSRVCTSGQFVSAINTDSTVTCAAGGGGGGANIGWAGSGTGDTVAAASTEYFSVGTNSGNTETSRNWRSQYAGTVTTLTMELGSAQTANGNLTCAFRINGVDTDLSIVFTNAMGAGVQTDTGSATVAQGDMLSVGCTNAAPSTASGTIRGWAIW
jgi:hypothetical protein